MPAPSVRVVKLAVRHLAVVAVRRVAALDDAQRHAASPTVSVYDQRAATALPITLIEGVSCSA